MANDSQPGKCQRCGVRLSRNEADMYGGLCSQCYHIYERALAEIRQQPWVTHLSDGHGDPVKLERPIPAPIGVNCPDHPTYPLVIHDGHAWCRRGQHDPVSR